MFHVYNVKFNQGWSLASFVPFVGLLFENASPPYAAQYIQPEMLFKLSLSLSIPLLSLALSGTDTEFDSFLVFRFDRISSSVVRKLIETIELLAKTVVHMSKASKRKF